MNKKKKFLIFGDSLSISRLEDNIFFEDTFEYLLKKHFLVINRARRFNDTKLQKQTLHDDIKPYRPDYTLIFLGLVDCAPRVLNRKERKILSFFPQFIRSKILSFINKNRYNLTKFRKLTYVSKKEFKQNLNILINVANETSEKVFLVKIIKPRKDVLSRSYNFEKNIDEYNLIIQHLELKYKNIKIIDLNKYENIHCNDGMHLNKKGHEILYKYINNIQI